MFNPSFPMGFRSETPFLTKTIIEYTQNITGIQELTIIIYKKTCINITRPREVQILYVPKLNER